MPNKLPQILAMLQKAGTAVVSDVFDNMDMEPLTFSNDLWPTKGRGTAFAGPAYTLNGVMMKSPLAGDPVKLKAIDDMTPGVVALFAGSDMHGVCAFGDLLASAMQCRGVAGVVVDGGIRDLGFIRQMELPMMARYRTPSQAIGRWRITAVQEPVKVRGALTDWITVCPGDLLVVDDDGVITVPHEKADEVADRAAAWESKDQLARADIMKGMKLLDAIEKHGAL